MCSTEEITGKKLELAARMDQLVSDKKRLETASWLDSQNKPKDKRTWWHA